MNFKFHIIPYFLIIILYNNLKLSIMINTIEIWRMCKEPNPSAKKTKDIIPNNLNQVNFEQNYLYQVVRRPRQLL